MRCPAAFLLLLAAGCSPDRDDGGNATIDINAAAVQAQGSVDAYAANIAADEAPVAVSTPAPLTPPAPGTPGGLPDDRTPLSEAPFTADSAQGAASVVETYYALLGEGKYSRAWGLWDDGGKASGMSAGAFAASFGKYSEYHANVGAPGEIDAGAGQRYVTVPVQVYGRLKQGAAPVYMLGTVVLHRTGEIDGATPAQKSWHIRSIDIKSRSGDQPVPAANGPTPTSFRCIDGSRIVLRSATATVRRNGAVVVVMKRQPDASGILYKGGEYELRGTGADATYTAPGMPPAPCHGV